VQYLCPILLIVARVEPAPASDFPRERISINENWRFTEGDPTNNTVSLRYDAIKQWVLPTGNAFLKDPSHRFARPDGNPGEGVTYVQPDFDDSSWQKVNLPHDWAIDGPF